MKRLAILLSLILLVSCSPKHLIEYRDRVETIHDTTYVSKTEKHTEYVRDSIFVKEKGDTVYQYVERWRYRDRFIHDTIIKSRVDTLTIHDTVTEYMEKQLSRWQQFRIVLGNIALAVIALAIVYFVLKMLGKVP